MKQLPLLLLIALSVTAVRAETPADQLTSAPLQTISVVGASVSAGFMSQPIASFLKQALPDSTIASPGQVLMFQDADLNGRKQISAAINTGATMVLAVDFLFWFAYRDAEPEQERDGSDQISMVRQHALLRGLAQLDRLRTAKIIVGDLPDMRSAVNWMLPPSVVPTPEELRAFNLRIREWAMARPNVTVLPMAEWWQEINQGTDGDVKELLAADGLHLTERGTLTLLNRVDRWLEMELQIPSDALIFGELR